MRSFLWLRVVSTQLTFGITLYTVTVSGSLGSKLPLAKDIRLCLCFIAFFILTESQCNSSYTNRSPAETLCVELP